MRKTFITMVGALLGVLYLLTALAPANATTGPVTVTSEVLNAPDNSTAPGVCDTWARSDLARTVTIEKTDELEGKPYHEYAVKVEDNGTFTATGNGVQGGIDGFVEYVIHGNLQPDQVEDLQGQSLDASGYDCKPGSGSELPRPGGWALQYFDASAQIESTGDWEYVYSTDCQTFTEGPGTDAVGRDFTFSLCAIPTDPATSNQECPDTPGFITLADDKGISWVVNGDPYEPGVYAFPVGGHTVAASADEGYVFPESYEADPVWHVDIFGTDTPCPGPPGPAGPQGPQGEPGDTPEDTTTSGTDQETTTPVASTSTLPKTGSDITTAGFGLVLLLLGGAVVFFSKRRARANRQ